MKKVVIVGGGFAGVETALRLKQYKDDIEILVIHAHDTFTFVPALYETAAGELSESGVSILMAKLLNEKGIIFYHDKVTSINPKKKVIKTERLTSIAFDYLVLAIGAETNYYGIPGAEKYSFGLKTKNDAQKIFEYVTNSLEQKKKQDFVVCGGGLTGVEFAASLKEHIDKEVKKRKLRSSLFSVTLVEAAPTLIANLPKKAIDAATKKLNDMGVIVKTNCKISRIGKSVIFTSQGKIPSTMAVWSGGLKTHPLIKDAKFKQSTAIGGRGLPGGGVLVNNYLQAVDYPYIFAAGDCMSNANPQLPIIKTAQNAVDQAKYVAKNINALLNKKTMKIYQQRKKKFYCAIGKSMGVHINDNLVVKGKRMKVKKDKLETDYVKTLEKGKLPKNIYG